jgi:glycosyltransferase involved in cell wall biosynthesis
MKVPYLKMLLKMLRAEGAGSLLRRTQDRLEEARCRRRFTSLGRNRFPEFAPRCIAVLNYLSSPPAARLGGVPLQLAARLSEEARERPVALLYPIGRRYRLELSAGSARCALEFERPQPSSPSPTADSFERVVTAALSLLKTNAVHLEGAAGVPLESVARLAQCGIGFVLSLHDFALFCLRPNLLEHPQMRFCDYCMDLARCHRCLSTSWPAADAETQRTHREAARRVLSSALAVVYPSEFLRSRHRELFSGYQTQRSGNVREYVIEPAAMAPQAFDSVSARHSAAYNVAFVGAVTVPKGALLFEETVERVRRTAPGAFRWSVLGGGEIEVLRRLRATVDVTVYGYYRAGTLSGLLRRRAVDLALLPSVVPESFGLTLSECWAAGVPVVAFDHGALSERISRHGGGVLVSLQAGSRGVSEALEAIAAGRRKLPAVRASPLPTPHTTAAAYRRVYEQLGLLT